MRPLTARASGDTAGRPGKCKSAMKIKVWRVRAVLSPMDRDSRACRVSLCYVYVECADPFLYVETRRGVVQSPSFIQYSLTTLSLADAD